MADVDDSEETNCSSDENEPLCEAVVTLSELKKRRQVLLAQKKLILNRVYALNNLPEAPPAVTDLPFPSVNPQSTDSDEEIAQSDTLAVIHMQKNQSDSIHLKEVDGIQKENLDTNDLKVMEMIDERSVNNDCDLMDIPTNELIFSESFNGTPVVDYIQSPIDISIKPVGIENNNDTEANCNTQDSLNVVSIVEHPPPCSSDMVSNNIELQPTSSSTNNILVSNEDVLIVIEIQDETPNIEDNNESVCHGDLQTNRKRKSKVNTDSNTWKKTVNKDLRMKGEDYIGYRRDKNTGHKPKIHHDVFKPARSMKSSCGSEFCRKSKFRNCDTIDDQKRNALFVKFWKLMNWEQRRLFICSHVSPCDKKQIKNTNSKRLRSLAYFLTIDNQRHQVCKKMFLNTLGIKDWFIRYWLDTTNCAMPPRSAVSRNANYAKKKDDAHKTLKRFLDSLPKLPSHYCRSNTSRQYLEPVFQTMAQLYNEYVHKCELDASEYLSRRTFDNIFLKQNLSLFHPKKDQCDVCCGYKVGNITDAEITIHRNRKNQARKEKEADKKMAIEGECHVFTQDLQSVKLAPDLQASAIYYKTKLCVHNFTMYNLSTREATCYWFDESNGSLEASVFASCIVDQLQSILNRKLLPVILFSDGCCAQNRNSILCNALLRLSIEKKVTITQKYLEKGHTQMECDSVHSTIECKLKGKEIYLPSQYSNLTKISRSHPMPYDSRLLEFSFFTDFSKDLLYKTIRPGRKAGDPTVTDLRVIVYKPDGTIWYGLNFNDPLQPLPQRSKKIDNLRLLEELPKLFSARLPITQRKYKDLQDLKSVIPSYCHSYYDELPYK